MTSGQGMACGEYEGEKRCQLCERGCEAPASRQAAGFCAVMAGSGGRRAFQPARSSIRSPSGQLQKGAVRLRREQEDSKGASATAGCRRSDAMGGMVQGAAQALDRGEGSCLVELTGKAEQERRSDGSSDRSIRQDHLHSAHNQVTGLILSGLSVRMAPKPFLPFVNLLLLLTCDVPAPPRRQCACQAQSA